MQSMRIAPTADPRITRLLTEAGRPIALVVRRPSVPTSRVVASAVLTELATTLRQLVTVHGIDLTAALPRTDELASVLHDTCSHHRRGPRTTDDIGVDLRSHLPLVAWLTTAEQNDAPRESPEGGLGAFLIAHRPALTFINPQTSLAQTAGVLGPVREAARDLRENHQFDMYVGDGYGRTANPLSLHQTGRLMELVNTIAAPPLGTTTGHMERA